MELEKEIARQIGRIESLQKEVFQRKATARDVERPEAMRKERAVTIRTAINSLQKRKADLIARMDSEIKALEVELKDLETQPKVDLRGVRDNTGDKRIAPEPKEIKRSSGGGTTKRKTTKK